jgi:hypothetical protein
MRIAGPKRSRFILLALASLERRLPIDHGRYVAYTGRSIKGGVIGFGTSIGSALSTFDHLYAKILGARIR